LFSSKVLALIAGVVAGTGGYDAATNTDLDAPALQGWTYVVTVAGLLQRCRAGDLIISKQNAPTTLHYTVVNKNIRYSSCYYSSWYYFSYSSRSKRRGRCK
jgi:hypothetical protein